MHDKRDMFIFFLDLLVELEMEISLTYPIGLLLFTAEPISLLLIFGIAPEEPLQSSFLHLDLLVSLGHQREGSLSQ